MQQLILRNPKLEPLTNDALRKYCPAMFVKEAHPDVSDRYGFFPTYKIMEGMHESGYVPVEVRNYQRRNSANMKFTKHMVRFRQAGTLEARKVGDVVPQIVLTNSHDRSSPFNLMGGLFRLACLNGLLVSEGASIQPIKVRHTLNMVDEVVSISDQIIKRHQAVFKYVDQMRKTKLTERQQLQFARSAAELRVWDVIRGSTIRPEGLLVAQRPEDGGDDVWHVFNRVQENLVKGGVEGRSEKGRRILTGEAKSIGADFRLNSGVWHLAMEAISKASKSSKQEKELVTA